MVATLCEPPVRGGKDRGVYAELAQRIAIIFTLVAVFVLPPRRDLERIKEQLANPNYPP